MRRKSGREPLLPWGIVVILCLTLGLAPFSPPHLVEKLRLLFAGQLRSPLDWFDLALHGAPWLLALLNAASMLRPPGGGGPATTTGGKES